MVASIADDAEIRRACAAAIGGAGSKQDIVLAIRVAKGRGILEKLGRVAKPRVLALTAPQNSSKGQRTKAFLRVLKYSSGGVLEPAKLYKLKHLAKVEVISNDPTGCTFILGFDNLRSQTVAPPQWTMHNIDDRNRLLLCILNMCKEMLGRLPKFIGIDIVEMALWAKENTPTVTNQVNTQDGPAASVMTQKDLKVTVEKDLVSQAEEEDMEALLGTYVMGVGEAEAFSERLKRELLALEAANVHALLESEPLIEEVLQGLEAASVCVDDMDEWLRIFNVKLRHMREDIESIESRNNKLEMQSVNNKALIDELDKLLECLRIPSEFAASLTGGSFDEARMLKNVEACEWLTGAICSLEVPNLDPCYAHMRAVKEKQAEMEKLKNTFVRRASEFLRNYFSSLVDFMISDKSYFSQRGQLKRPDHADLRYKCRTYARLLQHLKSLDKNCLGPLRKAYCHSLNLLLRRAAREFANELRASTKASRNPTGWLEASTGSSQTANSTDTSTVSEAYSKMLTIFIPILVDEIYKETHEDLWLEYAVSCCFQGIKYGVSNSRSHLARVLYHLSFDTPSETVGRTLVKYLDQLPHWVWLPWIPQLLLSLQRREGPHCKLVLLKIAQVYPQALYYWLRTYLMERRDVANKSEIGRNIALAQQRMQQAVSANNAGSYNLSDGNARGPSHVGNTSESQVHQGSQSGGVGGSHDGANSQGQEPERSSTIEGGVSTGHDQPSQSSTVTEGSQIGLRRNAGLGWLASAASAFDAAKEIMEALRNKHPNLASELEILLSEIGSRFVTLPEERLLAVVNALLHRCYKYPTATTGEVPPSLKKELSGVCRACFSADAVNKHVDFVQEYKHGFERDLDPESTATFPATLSELTGRLKHWKNILQGNVEDRFPAVLKLEEESKVLRDFHVADVEVPGQYFTDQEVAPDHTIKLDRVGSDIPIVRRHGSSFRRLTLIGSDGSQRHFIVQTSLTPNARSDERMLQLFRVLNKMFDKHKESRRRHLSIHTPIIIPVWSQVRMVEDDLMYSTFLEVYEINCARHNREADIPITLFKEQLNQAISGQVSPEAVLELRLQAYNEITKNVVNDNIFSQYMYKTLPSGNHLWTFKKQFAIHLALSCFMSYMLQIGGRSPNKILFAKNTGKIFQTDFHPAYDANGMIEFNEPVPFRLTRNMQAFFSHFGVEGLIVSAMCAAAQSIISPKQSQHIWHHLAMFFRDELLSWSWRRPLGNPSTPVGGGVNPMDFQQKVTTNVDHVIGRIRGIAPQNFSEEEENTTDPPQSVQRGVTDLVDAALAPRSLCMMDPTWHPWF